MDFLPDKETLSFLIVEYGAIALFALLALEIIALPIPGEPLMVLTGVLMEQGDLSILPTLTAAYLGAACGISVSYALGRTAGAYLVTTYGHKIGLGDKRIEQMQRWYERFGKWTLFIGYFVPGIRHFTGFSAGLSRMQYQPFAIFAYGGAFIWVTTFVALGYFLGDYWVSLFELIWSRITAFFGYA